MSEPQDKVENTEADEKMKRFNEHNKKRNDELYTVASTLLSTGSVKTHKGIFL